MEHASLRLKCDNDVLTYRQISKDTIFLSVLRQISHTLFHGIQRRIDLHFLAVDLDLTCIRLVRTVNGTHQFGTSGTQKSCQAHNLTFVDSKIKRFDTAFSSNLFSFDNRFKLLKYFMISLDICQIIKVLAHHLGNQFYSRQFLYRILSNQCTISKNSNPVTDRIYLLKEMRNKDNTNAFFLKTSHQYEKFLNFFIIQRRCRFIQNQNLALHIYRSGNGNHLLLRQRTFL